MKIQRYNPAVDTGIGNQVYLINVVKLESYDPPKSDKTLIAEGMPLWQLLMGFTDYVNKIKQDTRFTDTYFLCIVSPAIEPHQGADKVHIPIDVAMLQGKGRYGDTPTPYRLKHWYPTLEHQMGSINSIVETGPYSPKLANQRNSTWELKSKYCFYFKWGGAELPEQEVENPKTKGTYIVPDNLQELQISDPTQQKAKHMLHAWDWRRGYITKSALKRICEDSETDESLQTDSEKSTPQKKKGSYKETKSQSSKTKTKKSRHVSALSSKSLHAKNRRKQKHSKTSSSSSSSSKSSSSSTSYTSSAT